MKIIKDLLYIQMLYKKAFYRYILTIKISFKSLFFMFIVGTFLVTILPSYSEVSTQTPASSSTQTPASSVLRVSPSSSSQTPISPPPQSSVLGSPFPEIKAIYKSINFPEKNSTYSLKIIGKNFSTASLENNLFISKSKDENDEFNVGISEKVCWLKNEECKELVQGKVISNRELEFQKIPKKYAGAVGIQIGVGEGLSNIYPTFLSPVPQEIPLISTVGVSIVIFLLILLLSMGLVKNTKTGKPNHLFSIPKKFFIDSETNTISLSTFQFYVWTFAAILGYLYLFFSRSLIQGRFEFIDIPSGLPGIILISSTTILLSEGISNTKGSKGAGNIDPEWSDLISIGGVITPERVQFLIWTILGSLAFIFVALLQTPENIKDLPQVPQGFLQLMGVSSFGYVGGKLARKAGPVINEVNANYNGNSLVVDVNGSTLSEDAICKIGGVIISSDIIDGNKPEIITTDNSNEPSLAKHLRLTINKQDSDWVKTIAQSKFKITNPDGQYAEWNINLTDNSQGATPQPEVQGGDPLH
jgi:hypothetical protein